MSGIYKSFGENVRQKRKDLGLSQEDFAELIKRDVRSVIAIETGQRNPTLRTIYNICKVLKTSSSKLLPF